MAQYTIGEFASMLGVTADTLRLYEKYGIITPTKDEQTQYRYYNDLDARNLLMSRWYRSMQIPLLDVAEIVIEPTRDSILSKIEETKVNIEEQIKLNTRILHRLVEIKNDCMKVSSSLHKCQVKKMNGIYRLKQTVGNTLLNDIFSKGVTNEWMDALPFIYFSFIIDVNALLSSKNHSEYNWGLAIPEEEMENFDIEIDENVEYIEPSTYVSSVILSTDVFMARKSLEFMLDFINENNYSIIGDINGKLLFTEKVNGNEKSYLEVNIPIA